MAIARREMPTKRGRRHHDPDRIGYGKPGPGSEPRAGEVAEPITFKVTSQERAQIESAVADAGAESRSDWIREVTLAAAQAQRIISDQRRAGETATPTPNVEDADTDA